MKRPIILFAIFQIVGIVLGYVSGSYVLVILTSLLFSLISILTLEEKYKFWVFQIAIVFLAFGALEYIYINKTNVDKYIPYLDKLVILYGYIDSEPIVKNQNISYVLKTVSISDNKVNKKISGKILLSTGSDVLIEYGTYIKASGTLRMPKGRTNLKGFDYKMYLSQKEIYATLFSRNYGITKYDISKKNIIYNNGLIVRNKIINVINKCLPPDQAGLLNGVLIGYRDGLEKNIAQNFSDAGLTHVMAVSGANVAFISIPILFLFKKMRLSQKASNIVLIAILIFFTCITGFEPSVLRAVIMAITVLVANLLRRNPDIISSISFASIILLTSNPNTLFNIGFQLSFLATLSLILFSEKISKLLNLQALPKFLADTVSSTIAAQIGVLPIIVYYFNKIPLLSILANILVVPTMGIITCIGFMMAIIGQFSMFLARIIGLINNSLLTFALYITETTSKIPYSVLTITTPSIFLILMYYLFLLYIVFRTKINEKIKVKPIIIVSIASLLLIFTVRLLIPDNLEVIFIDVGQGDCALIKTSEGKTILIDAGGKQGQSVDEPNVGDMVVVPFLLDYGISSLDAVVATHAHDDHIQGLFPVLKDIKVKNLLLPINNGTDFNKLTDIAASKSIPVNICKKGDKIQLDRYTSLLVLHPDNSYINNPNTNDRSLVLKLMYKDFTALFTGDIEQDVENQLVKENLPLRSVLLKLPHHGSSTSSSEQFLKQVKPDIAVISVGTNTFGHPSKAVLTRFESLTSKVFRTDNDGLIIVKSNGKSYRVNKFIGK